jgi:hypothetical protein
VFQHQEAAMNIFKNKHYTMVVVVIALFVLFIHMPLSAKERRGSTVVVTMTDGRIVRGELLAVKADALLIYNYKGERLDLQQVAQVKVLKKLKPLEGLVIGFGAGVVVGVAMSVAIPHEHYNVGIHLFLPPEIGCLGGIIGFFACNSNFRKFSLPGESIQSVQQNLERLKRYAREQEVEKPVAN